MTLKKAIATPKGEPTIQVELTESEREQRTADNANALQEIKLDTIEEYGKAYSKGKLTHNGFSEDFTSEQRIEMKQTIDFLRESGVDDSYTITWYGTYGEQVVSLGTLVGWLMAGGQRRQKRFDAQAYLRSNLESFSDISEIKTAFDNFMAN